MALVSAVLAATAIDPTSSAAEVKVIEKEKYYTVRGASTQDILVDIVRRGPTGAVAHAQAKYRVRYKYRRTGKGCSIGSTSIRVSVKYTYPRWNGHRRAGRCTLRNWAIIEKRIRAHERTHGASYIRAARDAERALLAIRPQRSCKALNKLADRKYKAIYKSMRRWNEKFDRREANSLLKGIRIQGC